MKQSSNNISARWVKDHISIVDLLTNMGYPPPKPTGKERYYHSPLRDDPTPSFCVDEKQNIWHDHGEGKGGTIIDFAMLIWKDLSFPELLEKIVSVSQAQVPEQRPYQRQPVTKSDPAYGILAINDLGNNPALVGYLERRGIRAVADGRIREVHYYTENANKFRTNFFAAGWQNELGVWEISSTDRKKLCLGPKAISFIPNIERRLAVFEGYFNYLSWLTDNPFATDSVLVLNSVALLEAGLKKAEPFSEVFLFLDNDPTGQRATSAFRQAMPRAIDCSGIYTGYNDYNDKIVAERGGYQLSR